MDFLIPVDLSRPGPNTPPPPLPPRQQLKVKLDCIIDCCTRATDAVIREGQLDDQYVGRQLNHAYGLLLDALVLDLDPTADCDCSLAAANDAYGVLDNVSYTTAADPHQATGERRGA